MKKVIYILTFLITVVHFSNGQEVPVPENYSIVDSVSGDLNKDSIAELVVLYNMTPEDEFDGAPRELIIYKLKSNKWTAWKKSDQALYGSKDGGMMADPYGGMDIKKGVLLITQEGGSTWRWGFTDKYRFQDGEFYLIGYSSYNGKHCENWSEKDFNLSTGKIIVTKEFKSCETGEQEVYKKENESMVKKGLKIKMQSRQERKIVITTPKYGHEIHIATGKE